MRRSSSRLGRRSPRRAMRKVVWARFQQNNLTLNTETLPNGPFNIATRLFPLAGFEAAYGASLIGCTIQRVRGYVAIQGAGTSAIQTRVGLKVTDDTVLAAGEGSLFDLSAQGGAEDHWMGFYPLWTSGAAATSVLASPGVDGGGLSMAHVDVRSRRKLTELGQKLVLDVSAGGAVATFDPQFFADLSILVALP